VRELRWPGAWLVHAGPVGWGPVMERARAGPRLRRPCMPDLDPQTCEMGLSAALGISKTGCSSRSSNPIAIGVSQLKEQKRARTPRARAITPPRALLNCARACLDQTHTSLGPSTAPAFPAYMAGIVCERAASQALRTTGKEPACSCLICRMQAPEPDFGFGSNPCAFDGMPLAFFWLSSFSVSRCVVGSSIPATRGTRRAPFVGVAV
jgi:hypothetical protein